MSSLNIERKVDSAEKQASIANKPTNQFIFAREFNRIVTQVENLSAWLQFNSETINAFLSQNAKVELGTIETDPVEVLNEMEDVSLAVPVLITYTIENVFFVKAFIGTDGVYGTSTNLTLGSEDFVLIYQSNSPNAQLQEYDFYGTLKQVGNAPPFIIEGKSNFPGPISITETTNGNYQLSFLVTPFTNKTFFNISPLNPRPVDDNSGRLVAANVGSFILIRTINSNTGLPERGYLNEGVPFHIKHIL
jgi:hypothetical protein